MLELTLEQALTLGILGLTIVLFLSERLRPDLVGLLVLVALVLTGLVQPEESIAGFANPAVVTIWSVFILSAGLGRTGVAGMVGERILRLAGAGEARLVAVLMATTAVGFCFMSNVAVAALFLPVTMDLARRTGIAPSRLLLPMAFGTLLGGNLILIGTASNLVVADFVRSAGLRPLGLFDFTPVGLAILAAALLWMVPLGRRLLPVRRTPQPLSAAEGPANRSLPELYRLEERLAVLVVPPGSPLVGKALAESRIGRALGLNVLSIKRPGGIRIPPEPNRTLEAGDRLLVLGRLDTIEELATHPLVDLADAPRSLASFVTEEVGLVELRVEEGSPFQGATIADVEVSRSLGVNVVAVRRGDLVYRTHLHDNRLQPGDFLIVQGPRIRLEALRDHPGYRPMGMGEALAYGMDERFLALRIPGGSPLVGRSLQEARFQERFGIVPLTLTRDGGPPVAPEPATLLREGDLLLVGGRPTDLRVFRGLLGLRVERDIRLPVEELEYGPMDLVEIIPAPHSTVLGKTLRELKFRERYGISVLAVWKGDRARRSGLGDLPLEAGDALLGYGPREQFALLAKDPEWVVLRWGVQEKPRKEKAVVAGLIVGGVVAIVLVAGWPLYLAAITGAAFMVLTRCLSMEEAYRSIEWPAVFLVATLLPLGLAMQRTGAAEVLARQVLDLAGPHGTRAVLGGLILFTLALNQFIPSSVNAVVMSPIALATAQGLGVSPYPFLMGIAYAAAASFLTPISHPANLLVMSPGGYRFSDYVKNGFPILVIVFSVSVALLPVVFPF